MTFAWYGHLKMKQEYSWFAALPLIGVIAFSWAIAFFEYSCQIPANRIGFIGDEFKSCREHHAVIQDIRVDRGSLEQHFLKIAKGE